MVNSIDDIINFIKDKSLKKIFVLCGKKSFATSGAEKLFKKITTDMKLSYFIKNQNYQFLKN